MRCAMTGKPISGPAEGVWDDGEWISWDWINGQLAEQELRHEYPDADVHLLQIFEDLLQTAIDYKEHTGRYLQIWGELGEFYAELKYGVSRHAPGTAGSDGRIGNDWIEVKTISPEKNSSTIQVKRAGNFNKLLVVRITENYEFDSRLIDRKSLRKGKGKYARHTWEEG